MPEWFREAVLNSKDYKDGTIEVALNDEANAGDQIFPKVKFHWTKDPTWVRSAPEEAALGGGWADKSAAFDPYKGPRSARTEGQDPTKWLGEWSVPGLLPELRKKIRAHLFRADSAFDRSPDPDSGALAAMRQAFDGIAQVLFDAGILTEEMLRKDIAELVWDSAIAGGWWRSGSESRDDIFPEQIGHCWVWRGDSAEAQGLFRVETREWRAHLLDSASGDAGSRAASNRIGAERQPIILGTAGQPSGTPSPSFATNPDVTKLAEEVPEMKPLLSQVAHFQTARAEAEVAFRQRELAENWGAWRGLHPWEDKSSLETTECPWWIAGAEYVFLLVNAWRTHFPGAAEDRETLLHKQLENNANWMYWNRVFVHDAVHAPDALAEDFFGKKNAERFFNFAFLFAQRRFAETDLKEWRDQAASLARAATDLKGGHSKGSMARSPDGAEVDASSTPTSQHMRTNEKSSVLGGEWPSNFLDFATEAGRNSAIAAYTQHWMCPEAGLARTARVDPSDLTKWKQGSLPAASDKKTRIENALRKNEAPTPVAKR